MGVYIKGMTYADALRLLAKDKKIIDTRNIIEVKEPHGRLIDADVVLSNIGAFADHPNETLVNDLAIAFDIVLDAPTVIEREGE